MKTRKHRLGVVVAGAGIAMVPWAAFAADGEAPAASATATAAQVDGVLQVGATSATAPAPADGEPAASGNAVAVGGRPLAASTGGSQQGAGRAEGNLFDTGETSLGRLTLTPWSAEVTDDGTSRQATGTAALAHLYLLDPGVVDLTILGSTSTAAHNGSTSSGSASTDAAVLDVADALRLELLHSEVVSDGSSMSYLASVNGNRIGSSDTFEACSLEVPDVLALACLQADGGSSGTPGATDATAEVLGTELVGMPAASVATSASSAGVASAATAGPSTEGGSGDGRAPSTADVAARRSPGEGSLAATGTESLRLALAAVAMLLLGMSARALARLSPALSRSKG